MSGRRQFLRSVAAATAAGLAGCTGGGSGTTPTTTPTTPDPPPQVPKLTAEDADPEDEFGDAVALDGDTALVGADDDENPAGERTGSAYVFERSDGAWRQTAKLVADDGDAEDRFGGSVAIEGDTAVVGAPDDDDQGEYAGSAYVFERSEGAWRQAAKLAPERIGPESDFGDAVALSGKTALVGAPGDEKSEGNASGTAYVFDRRQGEWTATTRLVSGDAADGDAFGLAVALDGDTALVGAYGDVKTTAGLESTSEGYSGAAYVFARTTDGWRQRTKLLPEEREGGEEFGISVDLEETTALVGAPGAASAFAFERTATGWTQDDEFDAEDAVEEDDFGDQVRLAGEAAVVSAPLDGNDNGEQAGAVFAFDRGEEEWTQREKILPADGDPRDAFGTALAVSGTTALVGTGEDVTDAGERAGSAYVFGI